MLSNSEKAVIAQTVLLEAESEYFLGKLAVAYVILNRMKQRKQSAYEVCWAPWQFSCWLPALDQIAKRCTRAPVDMWADSWKAVELASNESVEDPSHGATHYLNIEVTKQQRGGSLPGWVAAMTHTATVGQHDFYKE